MITLPANHHQRLELNDEVHARPPDALVAPVRIAFLALFSADASKESVVAPITDLARRFGLKPPEATANHFSADLGPCRVTWERHTEFTRYSFIENSAGDPPFAKSVMRHLPQAWIDTLPGQVLVAAHLALVPDEGKPLDLEQLGTAYFDGNVLIGAHVADAAATAVTDFRIQSDGFSRVLVLDRGLAPRQAGRTVQRLLEIDAYRQLALLTLPIARELTPQLSQPEHALAEISAAMTRPNEAEAPHLLEKLIQLAAEIESRRSKTFNRFSAANAYYDLVSRRINELRETRIAGVQTFEELTERRLAPAMNTCRAVSARQEALSTRVTQATQLLSTRVDIAMARQNQSILETMNQRATLQLRLQETVEGLSVAAVTYYIVGLVSYVLKGGAAAGWQIKPDLLTALSIPVVALIVAAGTRAVRRRLAGNGKSD